MAGPFRLYFDAWAAIDPEGTALGELTNAREKTVQDVLSATGSGSFVINRHDAQAAWCATGNLIRVRKVAGGPFAWNSSNYKFAFYIEDGEDELVSPDEDVGEDWQRGGRGILAVLERLVWWFESFASDDGSNPLIGDEAWEFPSGDEFGHMLQRTIREWNFRPNTPIPPSIPKDFDQFTDSGGVLWDTFSGEHAIDFGDDYLKSWMDLVSQGIEIGMSPNFQAHAWNEDGKGSDKTATIVFRHGWNIREGGSRSKYAPKRGTRALVKGKATEDKPPRFLEVTDSHTAGDEAGKWGRREVFTKYERTRATLPLTRAGRRALRRLRHLDDGPPTMGVTTFGRIDNDGDGGTPEAFRDLHPWDDYETGDLVTVDIPGEYNAVDARVAEITVKDGENGDAEVTLTFDDVPYNASSAAGSAYGNPVNQPGGGGRTGVLLCAAAIACPDLTAADLTAAAATNGDTENAAGGQWSGGGYQTSHFHAGVRSYGFAASAAATAVYTWDPAQVFQAGVRYVLDVWSHRGGEHTGRTIAFGVAGGDEEVFTTTSDTFDEVETGADGNQWGRDRVCWTPTADRTGVRMSFGNTQTTASFFGVDDLSISTATNNELAGDDKTAARCDHRHRANAIVYSNAISGLAATNVQDAIDEIVGPPVTAGGVHAHLDYSLAPFEILAAPAGGWTYFGGPETIRVGSYTYIGYVRGDNGDVCLSVVANENPRVVLNTIVLHAALDVDDHPNPSLAVLPNGKLGTWYARHEPISTTPHQRISTNTLAADPTLSGGFAAEQNLDASIGATSYDYLIPIVIGSTIHLFFRNIPTGTQYELCETTSTDNGATWSASTTIVANTTKTRRAYWRISERDGIIHFAITDGSPNTDETFLYHFARDGASYLHSDGTAIAASLPLDVSDLSTVYDAGNTWILDIAIAPDGKAYIVHPVYPTEFTDHRYHFAAFTGSNWTSVEVCEAGGGLDVTGVYSGGARLDPESPGSIAASIEVDGEWEIWQFVTSDGGASWNGIPITQDSTTKNIRPVFVRDGVASFRIAWMHGTYTGYTTFSVGTWGAGLVAGTDLTAADVPIDDAGAFFDAGDVEGALQEIGESLTAAAGHFELLMTGSSPPEPLEDGTGADWLYVWVSD